MRPPGEFRRVVLGAFEQQAPCTWRAVIPSVGVHPDSRSEVVLLRRTTENLIRAGQLREVGRAKLAGEKVWRKTYEPASAWRARIDDGACLGSGLDALDAVARSWVGSR